MKTLAEIHAELDYRDWLAKSTAQGDLDYFRYIVRRDWLETAVAWLRNTP